MDYKEKQQMYRDMKKYNMKLLWVSKEQGDLKGRTYKKTEMGDLEDIRKKVNINLVKDEEETKEGE